MTGKDVFDRVEAKEGKEEITALIEGNREKLKMAILEKHYKAHELLITAFMVPAPLAISFSADYLVLCLC